MNEITKALLKDLQEDLDCIKNKKSDIEVIGKLDKMIESIKVTRRLILEQS